MAGLAVWAPQLIFVPVFLPLLGVTLGMIQAQFPIAGAILLSGGRATKVDFAGALVLLATVTMLAGMGASAGSLFPADRSAAVVGAGLVGSIICALVILLPFPQLSFDNPPAQRHIPLNPRRRSPWMVLLLASTPPIAAAGAFLSAVTQNMSFFEPTRLSEILTHPMALLALVLFALWFAVLGYWLYRIHGELAGVSASQRLLTPRAASMIGLFVPLGMPVILVTRGDLLNDRLGSRPIDFRRLT